MDDTLPHLPPCRPTRLILGSLAVISCTLPTVAGATTPDLASMIASCPKDARQCVIDLHGARHVLTDTLRINPLSVTLRDGTLDATHLAAGHPAILVTSDGDNRESYDTAQNTLAGLVLLGSRATDGIVFDNRDKSYVRAAAMTIENVAVSGFRRGLVFANHAYGLGIAHVQIHNNEVGVYTVRGAVDAGERIAFSDAGIFNNHIGIDDEGGMEMDWVGSRWDYNDKTAILAGLISFDGHMEMQKSATPVIELRALENQIPGALFMSAGSFVLVNASGGQAAGDYWISSTSPDNIVQFPASTYGVRGRVDTMQGPGRGYGPAMPPFKPK